MKRRTSSMLVDFTIMHTYELKRRCIPRRLRIGATKKKCKDISADN